MWGCSGVGGWMHTPSLSPCISQDCITQNSAIKSCTSPTGLMPNLAHHSPDNPASLGEGAWCHCEACWGPIKAWENCVNLCWVCPFNTKEVQWIEIGGWVIYPACEKRNKNERQAKREQHCRHANGVEQRLQHKGLMKFICQNIGAWPTQLLFKL